MVAVSGKAGSGGVSSQRADALAKFLDDGPANSDLIGGPVESGAIQPQITEDRSLNRGSVIGNGVLTKMREMAGSNGVKQIVEGVPDSRISDEVEMALDALRNGLGPVVDGHDNQVFQMRGQAGIGQEICDEFDRFVLNLN